MQPGNTWHGISGWSGISIATLKKDNPQQAANGLLAHHPLILNGLPDDFTTFRHRVEVGQTISGIADLYRVQPDWLMSWNGLRNSRLAIGQTLLVHARESAAPPPGKPAAKARKERPASASSASRKSFGISYSVQPRNTLGSISRAFGVDIAQLRRHNRIKGNRLNVGHKLIIPVSGWKTVSHKVRRGDTLAAIADRHGTTSRALMTFNGLRNSRIEGGETLMVYHP